MLGVENNSYLELNMKLMLFIRNLDSLGVMANVKQKFQNLKKLKTIPSEDDSPYDGTI